MRHSSVELKGPEVAHDRIHSDKQLTKTIASLKALSIQMIIVLHQLPVSRNTGTSHSRPSCTGTHVDVWRPWGVGGGSFPHGFMKAVAGCIPTLENQL